MEILGQGDYPIAAESVHIIGREELAYDGVSLP